MENLVRAAVTETGIRNVCLAGGVALNSVANGRLARSGIVDALHVQPASGDAGGALGAALAVASEIDPAFNRSQQTHASWGKEFSNDEIKSALTTAGLKYQFLSEKEIVEKTAQDLLNNEVIGWYQGRAEWGPRALGNRSIIANPSTIAIRDRVNDKIKFRELFRPFAPAVLEEEVSTYFDAHPAAQGLYPFMLSVVPVRIEKQPVIPAVTHIDGSARIQTVNQHSPHLYRALIQEFAKLSGTAVILNTSFNVKGEPIVNSPADAIATFLKSGLDVLVMGQYYVKK
jgi:carbamoyltransferase